MGEPEEVVRRLDRRPGFKVVSHCEVGLPIFMVSPLVTLRERTSIGVLEETVLKCIDAGVSSADSIAAFLGIPEEIVRTQLGGLLYENLLRPDPKSSDRYGLTARGVTRLAELATTHVHKEDIRLYVDGLTRQIVPLDQADLYSSRQLETQGIAALTPSPRHAPKASEISISDINRLFSLYTDKDRSGQLVLKIEGYVKRSQLLFRRAIAAAFKSDSGREMNIAFAVDSRLSEEHEVAFARSGADHRSTVFKDLFDANKRRADISVARRHIQEFAPKVLKGEDPEAPRKPTTLGLPKVALASPQLVKTLSSYEHPPLLDHALSSAEKRLLIVSPWIRRKVVDKEFVDRVEKCLQREVRVTIAFGFGKVDREEREEDSKARQDLERLANEYANLRLVRKSNIHAKVLLVDSRFFVTTSFNWLSFRGDPNQPLREEEGTYVEGPGLVEEYFQKLETRLLILPQ